MVVAAVRRDLATSGVSVTESKMLKDAHTGVEREVDVVIEGDFDGESVVTSIEVIEHGRPASITWVEQQIGKHRYLPTTRLVLVSKSGFSRNAIAAVAAEGGWVDAIRPEVVEVDGELVLGKLFVDEIEFKPTVCRLHIRRIDGEALVVRAFPDNIVFDAAGNEVGTAIELATEVLNLEWLFKSFMLEAHNHPERDALEGFSCAVVCGELGYHLRDEAIGRLDLIEAVDLQGEFQFAQNELAFTETKLANRRFGVGESTLLGRPAVWVQTTDPTAKTTKLSWRTKDDKPLREPPPVTSSLRQRFYRVHELEAPPGWPILAAPGEVPPSPASGGA
jgi:hypothetical protein